MSFVWVFHGDGGHHASGVFSTRENADAWIKTHALSGLLTRYPLDVGSYDWAVDEGLFTPRRDDQSSAKFIRRFVASSIHFHYEGGVRVA